MNKAVTLSSIKVVFTAVHQQDITSELMLAVIQPFVQGYTPLRPLCSPPPQPLDERLYCHICARPLYNIHGGYNVTVIVPGLEKGWNYIYVSLHGGRTIVLEVLAEETYLELKSTLKVDSWDLRIFTVKVLGLGLG